MSCRGIVRLGFVPLNDAGALIAARELAFFQAEGLTVELSREASWATVRDKLAVGLLDGAHMLAPLALAMTMGLAGEATPMVAPLAIGGETAAITIGGDLAAHLPRGEEAAGLAALVRRRKAEGATPFTFASVFPYSIHEYLLRQWMASAGIDPDDDVRLIAVAPPRAADLLAERIIEGFCAGEPWNTAAVAAGAGRIVARAHSVTPGAPDKVFAVTGAFAGRRGAALAGLVRALARGAAWIGDQNHRAAAVEMLSRPGHVGAEGTIIAASLAEAGALPILAERPDLGDAEWILRQMRRWGQLIGLSDAAAVAAQVYRPDLYEDALAGA